MTYNPSIPLSTDIPAQSQAQFLTNFSQLNSVFSIDHVAFNNATAANRGKHIKSTYIEQTVDPVTAANEIDLYSKDVAGNTRLFLRPELAGSAYQFTGPDPVSASNGYTFLPGGLLLQWGNLFPGGGLPDPTTVTFPIAFTIAYSVTVTPVRNGTSAKGFYIQSFASVTPTGFTVRVEQTGTNGLFYIAIGTKS